MANTKEHSTITGFLFLLNASAVYEHSKQKPCHSLHPLSLAILVVSDIFVIQSNKNVSDTSAILANLRAKIIPGLCA
jgi:hypothetical protein